MKNRYKYKKILKAFGGHALYLDKYMLTHLDVVCGDEVCIELVEDGIKITKADVDNKYIMELLNCAKAKLKRRI
jgi:hypothetical protein